MYNNPNDMQYTGRSRNPSQSFGTQNFYTDDMLYMNSQDNFHTINNSTSSKTGNYSSSKTQEKADLTNSQIKFKPKFFDFDLAQKKYKGVQVIISSKSQLPQLSITQSLQKKIQKNLSQATKKDSYIFITKQTADFTNDKKFILDEISYSTEEAMEENYYDLNKYPILLVTSALPETQGSEFDNAIEFEKEFALINNLCKNSRMGFFSLFSRESLFHQKNTDFSMSQDQEISQGDSLPINSSDLLYLNMFRIFTFLIRAKNSSSAKYVAHRVLYFPNVSFKLSSIQQPFKLVSTPMATLVTKKQKSDPSEPKQFKKPGVKFGFVSLDANQRMLLFSTSDPLASQIPLIGLWIYGINPQIESLNDDDPEKRVLQGILFEYINCTLANRYSFDKTRKTFLLAMFSPEDCARYYETEFMENFDNQEVENKWLMLKVSRDTTNINDAIDYLQWSFMLSPENIIKDANSLKKSIQESAQNMLKDSSYQSTKRIKNNDSLSNYLNTNAQSNENFSDTGDDEIDNYDLNFKLPKPQPQPQLQPQQLNNHRLDESKDSQKTGTFIHGNEQTFDQESRGSTRYKSLLTDSLRKINPANQQWDSNIHQSYSSNYEKLSPFAEQLLNQQSQQLKFLQDQILTLQTALLNYQTTATQGGFQKLSISTSSPTDVKPPDTGKFGSSRNTYVFPSFPEGKATRDIGTDPIEEFLPKKMETKSTNTSFVIIKDEPTTALSRTESIDTKERVPVPTQGTNVIENFFETTATSSDKPLEEKIEYNPGNYSDRFMSRAFERYGEQNQDNFFNKFEEKPKVLQEDFRERYQYEPRGEDSGYGSRLFKDITNDTKNTFKESEVNRYGQMDRFYSEDYSYQKQKPQDLKPFDIPQTQSQQTSNQYISLKENAPITNFLEENKTTSSKFGEILLSEKKEPIIKASEEEPRHSRIQSTYILAPLEGQETSIRVQKMKFSKTMLKSDSDSDDEIDKISQKYLTKKVY